MSKDFTYTLKIDAEIQNLVAKTEQAKKSMQGLMDSGKAPEAKKMFDGITTALDNLQKRASVPIKSETAFNSLLKDTASVSLQLGKLGGVIENVRSMAERDKIELLPSDLRQKIQEANTALQTFSAATEQAEKKSQKLVNAEASLAKAQKDLSNSEGKISDKKKRISITQAEIQEIEKKKKALEKFLETQAAYEKAGANKSRTGSNTGIKELEGKNLPADRAAAKKTDPSLDLKNTEQVQAKIQLLSEALKKAEQDQRRYQEQLRGWERTNQVASESVQTLRKTVDDLNNEFKQNKTTNIQAAYAQLRTEAEKLGVGLTNIPIDYSEQAFEDLNNKLLQLEKEGLNQVSQSCDNMETQLGNVKNATDQLENSLEENAEAFKKENAAAGEVQGFISRIKQFVGLQGAAMLARRALQSAFNTIKELDAAMTEMAVVTDLEIGDYWKKLPEFTENANALGVFIQGAYEATTLYLQQGLKMNEAQELSNQTLKMARIAGLEASEATDKMTAALRGFNMELNEASAQKVADVYSQLAAITAADVNEISSAMTKTASIASSAGMEFETTAAFLSQIIETTRESAETAGTALKTVIARFQELKKDPSEIGEVDGEVVDANKIETALRSVGVALRDSEGQFRELDDVFMDLSSKWDSLSTNTQRYIATIAAGSRQQSRFIAMMQDYSRTQELVNAANASAGASNEQFEKTLDSLESKLAKLTNSWNTFTMSLMNNEFLKGAIEVLVAIMNAINGVVAAFDKIGLGSVASLAIVVGALVLGTMTLNAFEKNLRQVDAEGKRTYTTLGAIGATGKAGFAAVTGAIKKTRVELQALSLNGKKAKGTIASLSSPGVVAAQEAYNKALLKEQTYNAQRLAAKEKINASQGKNAALNQHYAATESIAAKATASRVAAEGALYAAMGLTDKEKAEAFTLSSMGIAADTAAILAKSGVTAAILTEYAATHKITEAEAAEILLKKAQNAASGEGVFMRMATALGLKLENGALVKVNKAKKANIATTIAQTVAQWAQNIAVYAGCPPMLAFVAVVLILVAALALLVVGIIALIQWFKKIKANSPEGKLESAKEAAEVAAEAADRAAEAYNNLADSFDNLADKYDALDELVEGTREWRDAVREINSEVLNLVEQYPELASLVTRGENGVLTIDVNSDEAQAVLDKYEQASIDAAVAKTAAKVSVSQAQNAVDYKNLSNGAELGSQTGLNWARAGGWAMSGLTLSSPALAAPMAFAQKATFDAIHEQEAENRTNTEAMARLLAEGAIMEDANGIWQIKDSKLVEELGLTAEQVQKFGDELGNNVEELREYGKGIAAQKEQEAALYEQMALSALQKINTANMSEQEKAQINNVANEAYIKKLTESAEKELTEKLSGMGKDEKEAYLKAEAAKLYEVDPEEVKVGDDGTITIGSGDEKQTISQEEFITQKAAKEGVTEAAENLQKLPEAISKAANKMGEQTGKSYKKVMEGKEGKNLTKQDIANLDQLASKGELRASYDNSEELKSIYSTFEEYEKAISESVRMANDRFTKATGDLQNMGADVSKIGFDISSEQAAAYANKLQLVYATSGQEGIVTVQNALSNTMSELSEEEKETFMRELTSIDWIDAMALDKFSYMLEEIGLSLPEDEVESFVETLKSAAGSINGLDFQAVTQGAATISEELKRIREEASKYVSEETYQELTKNNPALKDSFMKVNDKWYYKGVYEDLVSIMTKSATTDVTDALQVARDQYETGNLVKNVVGKYFYIQDNIETKETDVSYNKETILNAPLDIKKEFLKKYDEARISDSKYSSQSEKDLEIQKNNQKIDNKSKEQIDASLRTLFSTGWSGDHKKWLKEVVSSATFTSPPFGMDKLADFEYIAQEMVDVWSGTGVTEEFQFGKPLEKYKKETKMNFLGALKETLEKHNINIAALSSDYASITDFSNYKGYTDEQINDIIEEIQPKIDKVLGEKYKEVIDNAAIAYKNLGITEILKHLNSEVVPEADAARSALQMLAEEAGVPQSSISAYVQATKKLSGLTEGAEEYDEAVEAAANAERELIYEIQFFTNKVKIKEFFEKLNPKIEEYNKLAGRAAKLAIAKDIGQMFGFEDFKTDKIDKFMEGVQQLTNPDTFEYGIARILQSQGAGKTASPLLKGKIISPDTQNYEEIVEWGDKLVEANLGQWVKYADGTMKFVLATGEEIQQILEDTGIIEEWENPYDELYNLNQELNALLREREKLERAYARAVKDTATTTQDLVYLSSQQFQSIYDEIGKQEEIGKAAKGNIKSLRSANTQFNDLYSYNEKTGVINIDYEKLESRSDEEKEAFQQFISSLEEYSETYFSAADAMTEALEMAEDMQEEYRQSASDLYDAVKDGIMTQRQEEIDKLSEINESINEAQSKMLDKIQEQIDDARQARDNAKKEEAIQDKMTRLAYLRRDTSGANDLEIAKLEKEITEEQQDYQDTLVDQAISDLQDANEKAAEQREKQIEIMENQLDEYEKSGAIWADVQQIINKSYDEAKGGMQFVLTDAGELAALAEGYDAQNPFKQQDIVNKINEMGSQASIYEGKSTITMAGISGSLQEIIAILSNKTKGDYQSAVSKAQAIIDEYSSTGSGDRVNSKEEILEDVKNSKSPLGKIYEEYAQTTTNPLSEEEFVSMLIPSSVRDYETGKEKGTITDSEIFKIIQSRILEYFARNLDSKKSAQANQEILKGDLQTYYKWALGFLNDLSGLYSFSENYPSFDEVATSIKEEIGRRLNTKITAFQTGGLANFTGPAWLDGTKSRPEIVLNQTDSANFMQLRDILSDILHGTSTLGRPSQEKGGDNYYDIEINVESLGEDYDVEQLADKIRGMIYEDASYRNVNTINFIR